MNLKSFLLPDATPQIHETVFVAPGTTVIGAVHLAEECSIWYGAVLRGDINRIIIGAQSNVQDACILHVSDDCPAVLGERVTLGHRAIVHACSVGDEVLVGMGAIILDGAEIGPRCIVAAGALIPKGMCAPEGSLLIGSPARIVRSLSAEERGSNAKLALKYVEISRRYLALGMGTARTERKNA